MAVMIKEDNDRMKRRSMHLKNLFLDPNNYRFADAVNYAKVSESEITSERVQKRTRKYIEGEKRSNIQDLLNSFRANGFLKVDVIQLKDLGDNNYLVIEGNRRVATLKCLYDDYRNGIDIGNLDPTIFTKVPAEIYDEETDSSDHLIIMGLKHISGNKKWPAINQAQLIYDYLSDYWGNTELYSKKEMELCSSLGITKNRLRTSQRAIHLINAYKESDYGDQFESDMYSIFEEIVKKTQIKEWLEWNEDDYTVKNGSNRERLFSWISKTYVIPEEYDETESNEEERVEEEREPIINKATEIRYLAGIINNETALSAMEINGSVLTAYEQSGIDERTTIERAISQIKGSIKTIKRYEDLLDETDLGEIEVNEKIFRSLLPQRNSIDVISKNITYYWNNGVDNHFSKVNIEMFKKMKGLVLQNLKRINIFAGKNNSGKTTILEAIFLLCCQNNLGGMFELTQIRERENDITPQYLFDIFRDEIHVNGVFNKYSTEVQLVKYNDAEVDKMDHYIASYKAIGTIDEVSSEMKLHTYDKGNNSNKYDLIQHLCKVYYSSPYFVRKNQIAELYNSSVEIKYEGRTAKDYVIEFIKTIDDSINDIIMTSDNGDIRFQVDSSKFPENTVDLSSYGDGLHRIFEMALCFASCRNGVLLIDELETAIHYSMLVRFTKFVQLMAERFNVQVFLTTHSKECVDAFIENGYNNEQISAYIVRETDNENEAKYISGERLERLIDLIAFDLRGGDEDED